jgi:hypothetical protein
MADLSKVYSAALTKEQLEFLEYNTPTEIEVDKVSTGGYVFIVTSEEDMVSAPTICKAEPNITFDSIEEALLHAFGDPSVYSTAEWIDEED